jgi:hypothetical protein
VTTEPEFKSDAFEAIHASASVLYLAGAMNKDTMRSFDESCRATRCRRYANPKRLEISTVEGAISSVGKPECSDRTSTKASHT